MKTLPILLIATFASLPIHANIPKKQPLVKYTGLWTNSPFTAKPATIEPSAAVNPFEDFTLTGIAPVPGGHRVTIMSKKNPDIKKIIEPGGTDDFKIVSVNRNPEKVLGTTVVLSSGSIQGTVTFEPEVITLRVAPAPPQGDQNLPPGVVTPTPPNGGTLQLSNPTPDGQAAQRAPRMRIVPPLVPAPTQQPQNQPSGDRRDRRRR